MDRTSVQKTRRAWKIKAVLGLFLFALLSIVTVAVAQTASNTTTTLEQNAAKHVDWVARAATEVGGAGQDEAGEVEGHKRTVRPLNPDPDPAQTRPPEVLWLATVHLPRGGAPDARGRLLP